MPVFDVPCKRKIPEGKFEQTHLQDVQISAETRNLASLSEMMIVIFFNLMPFTHSARTLFPISRHFHIAYLLGM